MQIPSNKGTLPNWNKQTDSPQLFNMWIDREGMLNYTPSLQAIIALVTTRAIWETPYDNGSFIVVTNNEIYRVKTNGSKTLIKEILNSNEPVEITENSQNQVTIVDGNSAYVLSQRLPTTDANYFVILGESQGFALTNPGSCVIINSFTAILDVDSGIWQLSSANNALLYDPISQVQIDPQLEFPLALRNINNNLFIFGTAGIERWEPTLNVNIYLFPLQKDMNFKINFGAISQQCIVSNINTIYFLSSRYTPMQLDSKGYIELPMPDKSEEENGIAKTFSEYLDVAKVKGSFYTFRGNYFYQLTFSTSQISWVYCVNSGTFANVDDYIIGSCFTSEIVITANGVYSLSTIPASKKRSWKSEVIEMYKGTEPYRNTLSAAEARMAQGASESSYPENDILEYMALSISTDRKTFGNSVRIPLGTSGQFNARTIWRLNITGQYITFLIEYFGDYPLTIESFHATIK